MAIVLNGTTGITTPGLDASGTNKFATTIGVGNATPFVSGAGITFPATQSASADANTLDDYEEGTFQAYIAGDPSGTQAFSGVAKGLQFNSANGRYTKIGKQVTVNMYIYDAASVGYQPGFSGTTGLWVAGLPFAEAGATDIPSLGGVFPAVSVGYMVSGGWSAGYGPMGIVEAGGTTIRIGYMTTGSFLQLTLSGFIGIANSIILTASYQATA